jgi:regulator of protease activity HflC (stomatin/prohibitin superfamily)
MKEGGYMGFSEKSKGMFKSRFKKVLFWIGIIIVLLILNPFYTVDQTDVAVVKTFGKFTSIQGPGLHMQIPMVQTIEKYYVGIATYDFTGEDYPPITVLSNDGLEITMDLSVQSIIKKDKMENIATSFWSYAGLENWGVAIVRSSVRDVIANYRADNLYGEGRSKIEAEIKEKITAEVDQYFEVTGILIRKVTLPQNLKTSIEQKLQAQQESLKMEYVLDKEKKEAERKVIEAKGIADYNKMVSSSLTQDYIKWYWVSNLDKYQSVTYVPVGSDGMPLFKSV